MKFNLITKELTFSNNNQLLSELKTDLGRISQSPWSITYVKAPIGETYNHFLTYLEQEEEEAIKKTAVVNYLLKNFKNLYLDRIELDQRVN